MLRAVLIANAGVLLVLLFGPNAEHRALPAAYTGVGIALVGVILIARNLIARRRGIQSTKVV